MMRDDNWITKYIESRVKRGKDWRKQLECHKKLADRSRYIRIQGDGFRAISIDSVNPCGKLKNGDGRKIPRHPELERALQDAMSPSNVSMPPGANKLEHRLQASLIRAAMQNDLRFGDVLPGLQDNFDDLIFITDEFEIKPGNGEVACRTDIVAIGRSKGGNIYCPVFIELKIKRSLGRLIEQLDNAHRLLCQDENAQRPFKEFLSAVSGVDSREIECSSGLVKKMLIWPKSLSGREDPSVAVARTAGFLFVEFEHEVQI